MTSLWEDPIAQCYSISIPRFLYCLSKPPLRWHRYWPWLMLITNLWGDKLSPRHSQPSSDSIPHPFIIDFHICCIDRKVNFPVYIWLTRDANGPWRKFHVSSLDRRATLLECLANVWCVLWLMGWNFAWKIQRETCVGLVECPCMWVNDTRTKTTDVKPITGNSMDK